MSFTEYNETVMVVDDIPANLNFLEELLTGQGYKVRSVTSGRFALQSAGIDPPDLVLLDINMPDMDGFEVCLELKKNPEFADTPVIFISVHDEVWDKKRAFEVGGVDYITKPFETEELLARVETHLTLRRYALELKKKNQVLHQLMNGLEQKVYDRTRDLEEKQLALVKEAERRQSKENALTCSEEKYRSLYNNTPVMMYSTDGKGNIINVNEQFLLVLGYRREEVLGRKYPGFLTDASRKYVLKNILPEFLKSGGVRDVQYQMVKKDGSVIDVSHTSVLERETSGNMFSFSFILDITEQKRNETRIKQNEKRLKALLRINKKSFMSFEDISREILDNAIQITNSKVGYFHIVHEHHEHLQFFSWSTKTTENCFLSHKQKYFLPDAGIWADCLRLKKTVINNNIEELRQKGRFPEGHINIHNHMGVPLCDGDEILGIVGVGNKDLPYNEDDAAQLTLFFNEIIQLIHKNQLDEQKKVLEQQLRQSQKMEAIGTLASGIAHDFNNILSPIIGYTEMLLDDAVKGSQEEKYLNQVYTAAQRSRDLIRQIMDFSRQTESELKPLRMHLVLNEVSKLIRSTLPSTIEIKISIDKKCRPVLADYMQIYQIVMNLVTNAFHAMQDTGGILEISLKEELRTCHTDDGATKKRPYACLMISDTGMGMEKNIQMQIFEPYFTTKEEGKGTGLGLSVVENIIKSLHGKIFVNSSPGMGTKFSIYLPVLKSFEVDDFRASSRKVPRGSEHILLVDDEPQILELILEMLQSLGYKVAAFSSSVKALHAFSENPDGFDLLFTDMTMPELTGLSLCDQVIRIRHDIPVIVCSGFSETLKPDIMEEKGIRGYLKKPILRRDMAEMIRAVLDASEENE